MGKAISPDRSCGNAVASGPAACFAGQATGLLIPRLLPSVQQIVFQENKTGSLIRELVAAGALKPTDKLSYAGEGCTTRGDPVYNATEHGIEQLLSRPAMNQFDNLYCNEHKPGRFHVTCQPCIAGSTDLKPLVEFIRRRLKFRLEGEEPMPLRWLGWLLNSHEIICHPDTAWPYWVDHCFDPGKPDWEADEWHEMEEGPERDARTKMFIDQWKKFQRDQSWLLRTHNMEPHTAEALAAFRKMDGKLADILGRMCATRNNPERGSLDFSEPYQMYDFGPDHILSHCVAYIQYNLQQGYIEVNDPFFEMDCTIAEMAHLSDTCEAILAPVFELDRYIHTLAKGKK